MISYVLVLKASNMASSNSSVCSGIKRNSEMNPGVCTSGSQSPSSAGNRQINTMIKSNTDKRNYNSCNGQTSSIASSRQLRWQSIFMTRDSGERDLNPSLIHHYLSHLVSKLNHQNILILNISASIYYLPLNNELFMTRSIQQRIIFHVTC